MYFLISSQRRFLSRERSTRNQKKSWESVTRAPCLFVSLGNFPSLLPGGAWRIGLSPPLWFPSLTQLLPHSVVSNTTCSLSLFKWTQTALYKLKYTFSYYPIQQDTYSHIGQAVGHYEPLFLKLLFSLYLRPHAYGQSYFS